MLLRQNGDQPYQLRGASHPVINHFVVEIENRLYDITGDVTGEYNVVRWSTYLDKRTIIRDCIKF